MTTTTPNEFLQFANEITRNQGNSIPFTSSSSSSPPPPPVSNNNGYTLTGLSVLNNLCHLIEQMHTLKAENDRLRARLELVHHVEKFLLKSEESNRLINQKDKKHIRSTTSIHGGEGAYDEDKSFTFSPSNSLKIKKYESPTMSMTSRERQGIEFVISNEDSTSMLHVDHDQLEIMENNLGSSTLPNWNKLRRALSFTRRRKQRSPTSPALHHTERTIPAISISLESDDDRLHDKKHQKKKKQIRTANNSRQDLQNEDTEDDEYNEFKRIHHERKAYRNAPQNERQGVTTSYLPISLGIMDDDSSLSRKQSKIAHYRHKLYSKLNTVKKQFSDQNQSLRPLTNTHSSTFDDIGFGLNHALLSSKLASAMTKSYQQKMREWQTMQKSDFLVNYRRQSVVNKLELDHRSRKTSLISIMNEPSNELSIPSIEICNAEIDTNLVALSPILSPNQRSLILYQWREIMSEEISLRHYHDYLERKMQTLKQLETDLKTLKTSIFCSTNEKHLLKHHSMTSIEQLDQDLLDQHRQTDVPQRCRSLQSLISMPASWILAVQSAAYSDILDGTSKKTTERAIIFNKKFFNQLKQFKDERQSFQENTIQDIPTMTNSPTHHSYKQHSNEKRAVRSRTKIILTRACLRQFSYASPTEIPQPLPSNPMIPLQTTISRFKTSSYNDLLSTSTFNEQETDFPSSSSSTMLSKRSKRSRFDLKKTLQRSKSICMTQFNSWLQRRRRQQQRLAEPRRKSAIDPKTNKDMKLSPCSTPKFLGSPRLARIHQRIFKQHPSPIESPSEPPIESPLLSSSLFDDSDERFQNQEHPVRIYLPARASPAARHVRITDGNTIADNHVKTPPISKITSPILHRPSLTSSMKTTARERRESFASQSKNS